jgi:AAA family ATP:ADP antiporter
MSYSTNSDVQFGTLRSFLWPIHSYELKKFLPMMLMLIFICFNYSILRNLKDSIVITTSGAEIIPFIKMWVLLPMAIAMTVLFASLSNRYSQEKVFYIMISIFLVFFALFAFVLYPLRDLFHPHDLTNRLGAYLPPNVVGMCKWFIALFENWVLTLFYVMAELWAAMILNVCFWGFANEVTSVREARRFYGVFGIGSNIAAVIAGLASICFIASGNRSSTELLKLALTEDAKEAIWQQQLGYMMMLIIASGLLTIAVFYWMNRKVLTDAAFAELHQASRPARLNGKKKKQSLSESLSYLKNSKYLICIATMVIGYNLSIHLVELVWKDQLSQLYPMKSDYMSFMSYLTLTMGVIATLTAFCIPRIISNWGWTTTALLTPITMGITSACFFIFLFFRQNLEPLTILMGTTPLVIAAYIGFVQNCFSKAAKYSIFDATQQMAYIPLDHESKLKGKAAIDGIGSRLGKSGGSLIHTGLLMIFHSLSASSPYVACILLFVIIGWVIAVRSLGVQFHSLTTTGSSTPAAQPEVELSPAISTSASVAATPLLAKG